MRQLPFDSGNFFVPACERWKQEALNDQSSEYLGDMLRIRTLVQDGRSPQAILRFFGLPDHGHPDRLFDILGDVQLQVFTEMLALTGEEYRIDWSRRDGAFCLWYRDRDHRRDATRDLMFVRANTKILSAGAEIRNSPVHGFGLFAVKKWYINDVFVESLGGQVLSHDEYELLQARLAPGLGRMRRFFFMEWNALPGDRLLARPFRTQYSYINHSTDPNVRIEPLLCGGLSLVISRDIEPEGEFFLDYRLEPLPRGYFESPYSGYLVPAAVR